MKVITATGSSSRTTSEIDLEIADLPQEIKSQIQQEAGEYITEQVLLSLAGAKSPVSGESFPSLSRKYKAFKISEGGSSRPDLELTGNLKDSLTFRPTMDGIEVGFFGKEADKADGHLKFSDRTNSTPQRRFLPGEGQTFKRSIVIEVNRIIAEKTGNLFEDSDFRSVENDKDLYDVLRSVYGSQPRSKIRQAVSSNVDLLDMLISNDLLRFL